MMVKTQLSQGWRIAGLLAVGCVMFAAGWWLKPVEIQSGPGGKIHVGNESARLTSSAGNSPKANTPSYDFLAAEFAKGLRATNSEAADEWVATIKNPARRKQAGGQ
jgi:hypothetical protein